MASRSISMWHTLKCRLGSIQPRRLCSDCIRPISVSFLYRFPCFFEPMKDGSRLVFVSNQRRWRLFLSWLLLSSQYSLGYLRFSKTLNLVASPSIHLLVYPRRHQLKRFHCKHPKYIKYKYKFKIFAGGIEKICPKKLNLKNKIILHLIRLKHKTKCW